MAKEKFYFDNVDSETCYPLSHFIQNAKHENLTSISLYEAIEDDKWMNQHYCQYHGMPVDNSECKKKECSEYVSKSGRGKCQYRGKLYYPSNQITTFKVD